MEAVISIVAEEIGEEDGVAPGGEVGADFLGLLIAGTLG